MEQALSFLIGFSADAAPDRSSRQARPGAETGREVVRDFGATPAAFAAQRRLRLLEMQLRIRHRARAVR